MNASSTEINSISLTNAMPEILHKFNISSDHKMYALLLPKALTIITENIWQRKICSSTFKAFNFIQLIDTRVFASECCNNLKDCAQNALKKSNKKVLYFFSAYMHICIKHLHAI